MSTSDGEKTERLARATDWDKVQVKCSVIGLVRPGFVSLQSEPQTLDLNDGALCEDRVDWGAMAELLHGKQFELPINFVPQDLRRPNSVFWLTVGNDGRTRLYRDPDDEVPAVLGPVPDWRWRR